MIELALRLYEKGIARLREQLISRQDFLEPLAKEGIPMHYGKDELKEELRLPRIL